MIATFLLDAQQAGQNSYQMLFPLALFALIFYFILWRPEQQRRKKLAETRASLAVGVKVTAMGIIAVVDSMSETTVVLKNIDGSKIEMLKTAISEIHKEAAPVSTT